MKFVKFIWIFFFSISKAKSNKTLIRGVLDTVDDIFLITPSKLNETVNKLFYQLQLAEEILKSKTYKKEFNMYKYLQNTESINYKVFKEICNITKTASDKKGDNNSLVRQVLNDSYSVEFASVNITSLVTSIFQNYLPRIQRTNEDDNLSLEFIKDFINKIDGLSINDFIPNKNRVSKFKLTVSNEDDKSKYEAKDATSADLSYWDPLLDKSKNDTRRLYGDDVDITSIKMYPFMASVHVDDEFVCSGCILSIDVIITAASCISKLYKQAERGSAYSNLTIRFGSNYAHENGKLMKATQVNFYPDFDLMSLRHNIAIIKVRKEDVNRVKWLKRVRYEKNCIKLKNPDEVERNIKVLGWGVRNMDEYTTNLPLSIDRLTLYDLEICQNIYTRYYVTRHNFCAGSVSEGIGACDKDIGGPGLYSGTLIGIISFGSPECGLPDSPTVFTRIYPYSEWIAGVINENELVVSEGKQRPAMRRGAGKRPLPASLKVAKAMTSEASSRTQLKVFRGQWNKKGKIHSPSLMNIKNPGQIKMSRTTRRFTRYHTKDPKSRYL